MLISLIPFYYGTVEQYYTGELIMQVVNGVDDGSLVYILCCILSGLYGGHIWTHRWDVMGHDMKTTDIFRVVLITSQIVCAIEK